ncbi:hypothetical protein V5O48_000703 [Marasmius crinis-equi]|uniref:BRCT domain-containing protein n=1 Tax=Marasmius crinis-equi TaxID=585013 RepID=A0ABR3G105_9AGAR
MADLLTLDRRTRSHLVLPDTALQLDRSPLKEARTAARNQVEVAEDKEDDEDSEEDPILLSPKKTNKRTLESPQAPFQQINPRFKRLKSEPYTSPSEVGMTVRPSHSRHGSESTVVAGKRPHVKHSAPPSVSKKPLSYASSENVPNLVSKPRAKSVPIFPTSLPSFPSIDLRHPPPSPTRSRSRSPSKREPKLDITFLPSSSSLPLNTIPDEQESAMDVDVRSPERVRRPVSEEETPIPRKNPSKPHPLPLLTDMASSSKPADAMKTPARGLMSIPTSPLTPIADTPLPVEKDAARADINVATASKAGPSITDITTTTTATNSNPARPPPSSRVPLPKKPNGKSGAAATVDPFKGPPSTAASSSKATAAVGNRKKKAVTNDAFSVLMGNRVQMTDKEKRAAKTAAKRMTAETRMGSAVNSKPSTVKAKMKARTKPELPRAVPIIVEDEDEEVLTVGRQQATSSLNTQIKSQVHPADSPDPMPLEPMPSSPPTSPTSLFSEPQEDAEPRGETIAQIAVEEQAASPLFSSDGDNAEERSEVTRPSPLFSLDGDTPTENTSVPKTSHIDVEQDLESVKSSVPQITPTTSADAPREPDAMVVDEPVDVPVPALPPTTENMMSEENPSPSSKLKGKRGPRKKGPANMPSRPTRVTRSVSSRKQPPEASLQSPNGESNTPPSSRSVETLQATAAETPPSTKRRRTEIEPTQAVEKERTDLETESEHSKRTDLASLEDVLPPHDPEGEMSSELSELPSDMEDDDPEEPPAVLPSTISETPKSKLPIKSKVAPSPSFARATQASIARAALPKTPSKSRSASPSKLPRSSTTFTSRLNDTQHSRPALAVAGSSYAALENALGKLRRPPPSRPNTSLGFSRDSADEDSDAPMESKDDAALRRSALGIGRPSSAGASSSASNSSLPIFKRPAPVQKDSKGIFGSSGTSAGRRPGAIMRGGQSIYDRIAGGARGQKASQRTALPTVIGSPVKGGGTATMVESDVFMEDADAGPSGGQGDLTLADITMGSDVEGSEAEGSSKGKKKAKEDRSRRASMALHALSQSLTDLSTARAAEEPPSPPRRPGLRSTSSSYPSSSSASKNGTESKKDEPTPTLSILSDCKVFVDYRSEDPAMTEIWVKMLKDMGARIMTRLGPMCTHILWKDGLPSTINRYRLLNDPKPFVVGNNWVVTCAQEAKRVEETEYLIEIEDYKFAAAGHKRRKSMIPKLIPDFGDNEDTVDNGNQDGDVSMNSDISMSSDLTPLERARLRQSMRT